MMHKKALIATLLLGLMLGTAATDPARAADRLDPLAELYVALILEYGTHEDGYVDAYYGPDEWQQRAEAAPRSLAQLAHDAETLRQRVLSLAWPVDPLQQKRRRFMTAQLQALETRIAMQRGQTFSFVEEAELLFGVTPPLPPLDSFAAVHARIEALVPGTAAIDGPLWQRVEAMKARYHIPPHALKRVMNAAIARCKAAAILYIDLPAGERVRLEYVTDKPWSGYNWYQGDTQSLIQINTDLPIPIDRAVDLGCHEGYPGHHTLNALLEQRLVRERGWAEFQIYPLYSPQSLIAEGSANAGIDIAFPGGSRTAFEAKVLYPQIGLDPAMADDLAILTEGMADLEPARYTIADAYLGGRISRTQALTTLQEVMLLSPERAAQSLSFIDTYRSYIVNYDMGRTMVLTWLDRQGGGLKARGAAFERLISEPTLPENLRE